MLLLSCFKEKDASHTGVRNYSRTMWSSHQGTRFHARSMRLPPRLLTLGALKRAPRHHLTKPSEPGPASLVQTELTPTGNSGRSQALPAVPDNTNKLLNVKVDKSLRVNLQPLDRKNFKRQLRGEAFETGTQPQRTIVQFSHFLARRGFLDREATKPASSCVHNRVSAVMAAELRRTLTSRCHPA